MLRFQKLSCLVAAFAFLAILMVGGAEAQSLEGKKLLIDTKLTAAEDGASAAEISAAKVNDGVVTSSPVATGDEVRIELYIEDGAGASIIGFEMKFENTANVFSDNWTISGVENLGAGLAVLGSPGADAVAPGGLSPATVPDNGLIGTIVLVAKADIAEGATITFVDCSVGMADFTQPGLDESVAILTFAAPPAPGIGGSGGGLQAGNVAVIPNKGTAEDITVSASNFADGALISWTVTTVGDGSLVVLVDGVVTDLDTDMMLPSSAATAIALRVSGPGDLAVTVTATSDGGTTDPVVFTFTEANPAELAAFGGELVDNQVVLNWTTVSQTNNAGWRMLRSVDGANFQAVSEFIQGAGTSDALLNYNFEDQDLPSVNKVYYVLEQVDLDGTVTRSSAVEVILGARHMPLPTEFATNVYPNPFNPSTTISYDLPSDSLVSIVIYDALGQEVRRLVSKQTIAGRYQIQWDSRDNQGRSVGSGVYIAQVEAGNFSHSQKMLLLK